MAPFPETAVVTLPLPAKDLLDLQESTAFRTLLAQVMDREEEVVDVWHEGNVRYERVLNRPDYEKWVPAIGRRYVKPEDIEFIDIIEYDPRKMAAPPYQLRISTKLPAAKDRVKIDRTIVIEEAGPKQCRYRITGAVKVKMFGIGHLVEKQVMSNSVDSLDLLREVVERYQRVRSSGLAAKEGAGAGAFEMEDDEPPEDADELRRISTIMQEPYAEPPARPESDDDEDLDSRVEEEEDADDDGSISSSSSDDSCWGPEASSASSASLGASPPGTPEGARQLLRQETVFHDAVEHLVEEDLPMADVDAATAAAMQRDLRRINTRLARRGAPTPGAPVDHVHVGVRERHRRRRRERAARKSGEREPEEPTDGLGRQSQRRRHRHAHRSRLRTEEDSARVRRWRRDKERWQRFWARAHVREAPASARTGKLARLANLLRLGEAVGWLKVHAHRHHGGGAESPDGQSPPRRGFRQSVKDKWHELKKPVNGTSDIAAPAPHPVAGGV